MPFSSKPLSADPDGFAPDGSEVRLLSGLPGASMAEFRLPPGAVAAAVTHRTVSELWFVLAGHGQIWRAQHDREEILDLTPGQSLTIPLGTHFQFRNAGGEALRILGVTMPPWPGPDEAVPVDGPWSISLR